MYLTIWFLEFVFAIFVCFFIISGTLFMMFDYSFDNLIIKNLISILFYSSLLYIPIFLFSTVFFLFNNAALLLPIFLITVILSCFLTIGVFSKLNIK